LILLGFMCSIGTTLTLPGIAGIALAIGMAVDANVLIYERLREELAAGKSLRGAISSAYSKAFGTIFDSNLTTLISALILIWMGSGPIKGFGVTLAIGLCVHMFTALVVTRLIFDFLLDRNLISTIRILPVIKGTKFDFLHWAKPVFILSWVLILGGIGYGVYRGKESLGVDFIGGETLRLSFAQKVEVDELRPALDKLELGDVGIQYQKDLGGATQTLRVTARVVGEKGEAVNTAERVEATLNTQFPAAKFKVIGQETVGAVVGKEIQRGALIASAMALFAILVYVAFRYEFSFAVAAVVAGIHDVLLTLGAYLLLGREVNGVLMAAVLTIIGYSINDKIVILDRIREDLKLGVRGSFKDLINIALNQTLSRTIITGGSVMLATLALLIFGGGAIKDFAIAFLIGTIVGTFSSIFIASPLVLWWNKGQRPAIGAPVTVGAPAAEAAKV
jgi:SecD/SecF fusion protein